MEIIPGAARLSAVPLDFCNCWCMNWPGEFDLGLMLRVELCAGEFPVPIENRDKIRKKSFNILHFIIFIDCDYYHATAVT